LPPPVKIEEVTIGDSKILPPFSSNEKRKELVLSPGEKQYEIHYTALSFLAPGAVRFKFKLEGFDTGWRDVGTRRTAYYTNLSPGNYTFHVTACNEDGIWNETGAAVSFYLKSNFYQTWWFYTLCAFGVLFLAFGIFRLRVRQITDRKIELERLVDERTRKLEESAEELEKLSIVARETDNAVAILDAHGNLEWMNEGTTRMYGFTQEELFENKGKNITWISSHPDIEGLLAKFLAKPEPLHYETLYTTATGKKIWTQTMWTPILDEEGNLTKIISIGSDISQIKQSKDKITRQNKEIREQNQRILEQAERLKEAIKIAREKREIADAANQAKSEFLARMSHEIRTPMNSVIGFSEMLMDTLLDEEQLDYAGTISRSGEALIAIINDILDFSSIEAGKLSFDSIDFDPELLAFDVCELTMPRLDDRSVEILCRIGDSVPAYVKQDPGRFRQVLVNLMGNAAKFTRKGEIQLSIDVTEKEAGRLKLHTKIRDTGIGIPPDKINDIFEVFQQGDGTVTREFGGTGLGLAISKQIAKHLDGDIQVESTPGQGSTFHFYAWVEKSKKPPAEKPVSIDLTGKRILIVDDNPNNLDILEHILIKNAMSVVKQTSGEKVILLLEENLESGTPFDLCILDLTMPELDGYELARRIRGLDSAVSTLPLLAFSASGSRQAEKLRGHHFDAFLPKPTRSKKLLNVIEQLFRPKKEDREGAIGKRRELVTQYSVFENAKHSVHILLAEDNPVNRKLAEFMLTKAGYRLDIALNGKEAVEKYTMAPDKYDLIFMDIQMPVMDGREATRIIRAKKHGSTIPIIAMTAESMMGDEEKCLAAGMDDYLPKPIRREIVFEMIKKWVLTKIK
ncbi:MAG: response regulator, partial [bacterium]|nr:response regulator [bacterium]